MIRYGKIKFNKKSVVFFLGLSFFFSRNTSSHLAEHNLGNGVLNNAYQGLSTCGVQRLGRKTNIFVHSGGQKCVELNLHSPCALATWCSQGLLYTSAAPPKFSAPSFLQSDTLTPYIYVTGQTHGITDVYRSSQRHN